ncbi:MAG: hypothetical protein QOH17_2026 [Pseudonocardiales bacterium]|nr:hypothetical protein [Pseudonocardiales bacterium]
MRLRRSDVVASGVGFGWLGGECLLLVDRAGRGWTCAPPGTRASWGGGSEDISSWRLCAAGVDVREVTLADVLHVIPVSHHEWALSHHERALALAGRRGRDYAPRLRGELDAVRRGRGDPPTSSTVVEGPWLRAMWERPTAAVAAGGTTLAGTTFGRRPARVVGPEEREARIEVSGQPGVILVWQLSGRALLLHETCLGPVKPVAVKVPLVDREGHDALELVHAVMTWND